MEKIESSEKHCFETRYSGRWVETCLPKGHAHPAPQNVAFGNRVFTHVIASR